jgi:lipopolysaccharide transport system ATP-binding protein
MDTPVKHYSSGMRVRLAFSVAAHLEPEILLIDEVLAVGDAAFQQKCLGKMEEVAGSGRTVLFVSHNLGVVTSLCSRAIWLHEGKLLMDADPQEVVEAYLSSAGDQSIEGRWENKTSLEPGAKARIAAVEVVDPNGVPRGSVAFEDPIVVRLECEVFETVDRGAAAVRMTDMAGTLILATSSAHGAEAPVRWPPGRYRYSCTLPGGLFRPGRYFLTVAARTFRMPLDRHEHCLEFEIAPPRSAQAGRKKKQGIVTPAVPWMQERIDESP